MKKEEFLQTLYQGLKGLPQEEIDNAMSYYQEYLEDAGAENEEEIIAGLEKPSALAAQIRADSAMKGLKAEPTNAKKGISAAWLVLLAILASPIALPVAIAIIAVFFALLITVFSLLFAFAITGVALIVAGIASGIIYFTILFSNIGAGLFGIGTGLACIGIGLLFALLTILFARWGFRAMAFLLNKLTKKKGGA